MRTLRKSHVNGATKLKLYSYVSIGKYLSECQHFPLGASGWGRRDPNVNLGPLILSRKLLEIES